eukprot:TRINITY_DN2691_c0_g1_i2.p1 TRINITY_DN2691_c0_g1~~TRINITY_DN2691_c0_g1_i2.p1  ORF type:complete len:173 (+),score=39.34 TRINITY_DN2691_c0_g1_i2:216-734(+)
MILSHQINEQGFIAAVRWTEPFMLGLAAFHLCLLVFIIITRKRFSIQLYTWLALLLLVCLAQPLNHLCIRYQKVLTTQPYFTTNGLFISTVFSAPLLVMALIIVINFLVGAVGMMVVVMRGQLREQQKLKKKQQQQASGSIQTSHTKAKKTKAGCTTPNTSSDNNDKKKKTD